MAYLYSRPRPGQVPVNKKELRKLLRAIQRDWHDMKHSGKVKTCQLGHCLLINEALKEGDN